MGSTREYVAGADPSIRSGMAAEQFSASNSVCHSPFVCPMTFPSIRAEGAILNRKALEG